MAENKYLRSLGGVPDNFGKVREQVKLVDREKIDDYKKLVRVLQEDNYKLEGERAKLKHMVKMHVMAGKKGSGGAPAGKGKYGHDLSPKQEEMVDEYAFKLKLNNLGEDDELDPFTLQQENKKLKAENADLLEARERGYDFIRDELERCLEQKGLPKGAGAPASNELQDLAALQAETRAQVDELLRRVSSGEQNFIQNQQTAHHLTQQFSGPMNASATLGSIPQPSALIHSRLRPPVARPNPDNSISEGYSHKFATALKVSGRDGRDIGLGGEADPQENAFLQLQLQECFELLKRKDASLGSQKKEIDNLHARLKKYLLMQDHLYKDFVRMEDEHAKQTQTLVTAARSAEQELKLAEERAAKAGALQAQLGKGGAVEAKRLVELTKENALLEVQLITMTRKCQAAEDELKLRGHNHDTMEKDMGDMEAAYQQKIGRLKETQRKQTFQLKQLYEKLRVAVPRAEYEATQRALETCKQRQGELFVRTKEWSTKVSDLQIRLRERQDAVRDQRELQASKRDLEKEYTIIKARLEAHDPEYRRENQLFARIVEALRRGSVTAASAFEHFDEDKDGRLSRGEFERALMQMGLYGRDGPGALTGGDVAALIKAIDLDGDGSIQYTEFERKLQRSGLRTLTKQELLMQTIIKGLRATGRDSSALFGLINKDGSGYASRQDFRDMLTALNLPGAAVEDLDDFIEYFYEDESRGSRVSLRAFREAYERLEKQLHSDATHLGGGHQAKKRRRVPRNIIERKQEIFKQIDFALNKTGQNIGDLFARVDSDGSKDVAPNELHQMLSDMKVGCTRDEAQQIFDSIDDDQSGTIELSELRHDYERCIARTLEELVDEENRLHRPGVGEDFDAMAGGLPPNRGLTPGAGGLSKSREIELNSRCEALKAQRDAAYEELARQKEMRRLNDESLVLAEKRGDTLRTQNNHCREALFEHQEEIEKLKARLDHSVSKGESERIQAANERLKTELSEAQGALMSAKSMQAVIGEQVKSLKLVHERKKDENESLANAVRDLQSKDFNEQKWGKLYQVVMLSRWQESAVNKKYKAKQEETAKLEGEVLSLSQQLENCRERLHAAEQEQLRSGQQVRELKNKLSERSNVFLSVEEGHDFSKTITELTEERSKLEERYFRVRAEQVAAQDMHDAQATKAQAAEALLLQLRTASPDSLSGQLMTMSENLREARLASMKAERKVRELGERENYLGKLLKSREDEVSSLGEKLAILEKEHVQAQEKWRQADNARMQEYYNPKFGQDTNVMAKGKLSTAASAAMAFPVMGPQPGLSESSAPMDRKKISAQNGEIQSLREELARAQARLEHKELADQAMAGGAAAQSFDLEAHGKMKLEQYEDEEKDQMRQAANETIRTLHKMLIEKNKSLSQKESTISSLRDEMADERKRAADRYAELLRQFKDEGKSTLAGLQRIVSNNTNTQEPERFLPDPALNEVGKQSEVALKKAQSQLRQLQSDLDDKQAELQEARAAAAGERARTREIQESSDRTVKGLEADLLAWKAKATDVTKAREEKNQAIIRRFDEKLLEYHKDKLRLEDELKQARMKAASDVSQRDKAKLSHKPAKEGAKAGQAAAKKKDGPGGSDEDYIAILNKGASRETLAELVSICESKDAELRTLRTAAKKATQDAATLARKHSEALEAEQKKATKLKEEVTRWQEDLRQARNDHSAEVERREEVQRDWNTLRAEREGTAGPGSALSYAEMGEKIKQLEKENFVLESQTTTVVAYNPKTSTFEYIGEPLPLEARKVEGTGRAERDSRGQPKAAPLGTAEEIVAALRSWFRLGVNDRLSVKQVFESLDTDRFGELAKADFSKALERLGVTLESTEHARLSEALDPRQVGYLGYRALVRELEGVPQSLFMNSAIVKLAGVAVARDLTPSALTNLLTGSPAPAAKMGLEAFQRNFTQADAPDFKFSSQEVLAIFGYITGAKGRADGVKIAIDTLVKKTFLAVHAILIERIRAGLEHAGKSVAHIFEQHDPRNVGFLERKKLSSVFTSLLQQNGQKKLDKNMENILFTDVFKPVNSKGNTSGKVSQSLLKFYLETFATGGGEGPRKASAPQQIDSSSVKAKQEVPGKGSQPQGVSPEMLQTSKRAARKILLQCHSNIVELVGKLDHLEEGIVNKQELKRAILDEKVKDLEEEELNVLLKLCDKGVKGYVSTNKVIEQLYSLSNESECDVILRRLSKTLAHQDVNLAKALSGYESQVGTVEIPAFKKCLQSLACALTEQEITKVANEVCVPMTTTIHVKQFVKQVAEAGKTQPLPNYITQGPRGSNTAGKGGKGNPMAAFDAEKKYKKNLEALKNEIEEKNREANGLRTEVKICHDRYNRLEQERKKLEEKAVKILTKPPRETANEALAFGQAQELKQLKEQLNYTQDENTKLNKTIDVNLKSEINRLSQEKDDLQEKITELKGQVGHLNTVINRIHGQSLDNVEKREELGLFRQLRIEELEKQLEDSEATKAETQDQLFAAQESVLDLKFEKETYDLQYARLQKRIQVLEQYKMSSDQLSAVIDTGVKRDQQEIHEIAGATASSRKTANDNVKMKFSKGKNSSELEMVVESLKRVVEKLKTENDHLKRENSKYAGQSGQASLEKSLRQKISNLEAVVSSHEMKEINLDEKQKTIKKLIDAHKNLQEDLHKEQDRYMLLEKKYKDVLVKFNISDQENVRNEELIFGMQTGSNMSRFKGFLAEKEDKDKYR